jgi:hypothetical protein
MREGVFKLSPEPLGPLWGVHGNRDECIDFVTAWNEYRKIMGDRAAWKDFFSTFSFKEINDELKNEMQSIGSLNWDLIKQDIEPLKENQSLEDWYWSNADYTETLKHCDRIMDEMNAQGANDGGGGNDNYYAALGD